MTKPIRTPRVNNNDDSVRLTHVAVEIGAEVRIGDLVAEVETDKASFSVEAEESGFVLAICHQKGDEIPVGSVLLWLGESASDPVPGEDAAGESTTAGETTPAGAPAEASLKARLLARQYNLDTAKIPHSGAKLSAADVEAYIQSKGLQQPRQGVEPASPADVPVVSGTTEELNPEQRGMLRTVLWHRDQAVPGYLEFSYDARPWIEYAAAFQQAHKMMFDPLLALMAYRLVGLAKENPLLNSTITGHSRYAYAQVNLGFTVQSGATLYMVVVRDGQLLNEKEFVGNLMGLQMAAMKKSLRPEEISGATLAFTSMARWPVLRHIPVLPPHVSFIVAHVAPGADGASQLGATYDHRVLTGFDAARILRELSRPPEAQELEKN